MERSTLARNVRAPAGQGLHGLKHRAREAAAALGHELGNFHQPGKRDHTPARVGARILTPIPAREWHARCARCFRMVVVIPELVPGDGAGFGGSAVHNPCTRQEV